MPANNRFQHQTYTNGAPTATYHLVTPDPTPPVGTEAYRQRMQRVGRALRAANVAAIYLVHGTFAGNDAFGLIRHVERIVPAAGDTLRRFGKQMFDALAGDTGNYTRHYARQLQEGISAEGEPPIDVRLFHWSSENHHVARADGAVRLIDSLVSMDHAKGRRVLLWGHSHAGNVFSLVTNLLAGEREDRERFFTAAGRYGCPRRPWASPARVSVWQRMKSLLAHQGNPLEGVKLDFVTFGTPIRYGWDTGGYAKLLHFVNHRPVEGLPPYRAPFPLTKDDVLLATHGDCIQQLAVAGTNLPPGVLSWRAFRAEKNFGKLLQAGLRTRDLLKRLQAGARVPHEGTTLLVNYGSSQGLVGQHLAGHAVYTREEHLLFHAEQIAKRLYGGSFG